MLKGIPKLLSPDLLKTLMEMGHGDELVLADANFPSADYARRLLRADGIGAVPLLDAVLRFLPLDTYSETSVFCMSVVPGDPVRPMIWDEFRAVIRTWEPQRTEIGFLERFAFYERAKCAYAIVATGEGALYANVILKKGVVPPGAGTAA